MKALIEDLRSVLSGSLGEAKFARNLSHDGLEVAHWLQHTKHAILYIDRSDVPLWFKTGGFGMNKPAEFVVVDDDGSWEIRTSKYKNEPPKTKGKGLHALQKAMSEGKSPTDEEKKKRYSDREIADIVRKSFDQMKAGDMAGSRATLDVLPDDQFKRVMNELEAIVKRMKAQGAK